MKPIPPSPLSISQPDSLKNRTEAPANDLECSLRFRFFVCLIFALMAMAYVHQFMIAEAIYTVVKYYRGGDFQIFYFAAAGIKYGEELYPNFIKPPLYGVLLTFLADYSFATALTIYQGISIALILGATFLFVRRCGQGFWVQLSCAAIMCGSWTFGYVIDRGNADGLSMGLALLACVLFSMRIHSLAWILFAVGVNIKTNILPLAVALVITNSLRGYFVNAIGATLAIVGVAGLTPRWNVEFFGIAANRVGMSANISENISIFRLLGKGLAGYSTPQLLAAACAIIALGSVFTAFRNKRANPLLTFLLLVPLTYAYPMLVYPYSMVLAPLLILVYGSPVTARGLRRPLIQVACCVGGFGVAAQCIPIIHWQRFVGDSSSLLYAPQVGTCLTLVANCVLAWSAPFQLAALRKESSSSSTLPLRVSNMFGRGALTLIVICGAIATISYTVYDSRKVLWFPQKPNVTIKVDGEGKAKVRFNRTFAHGVMTVGGKRHMDGLGTHTNSRIVIGLPVGAKLLKGACGVDEKSAPGSPPAVCAIKIEGKEVFRSKELARGGAPEEFNVPIEGVTEAELLFESTTSEGPGSAVDWLNLWAH